MSIELSIIMPCLNEAETLATCIRKANVFLKRNNILGEIVVGDNGSTDGSQTIAKELGARVIDVPVRGYGAALFWAISAAEGRYCIMGDSDDSYDFDKLELFVEELRGGVDLVMGNRFRGGIAPGAMPWKNRYIGNPVLSGIGRLLFKSPAKDFHCGLRGFSKEAFLKMDLRTTGMEFASEMVIKATLLRMRIAEVPTTLSPDGRSRPPHLRPFRDGWRHLRFMLLFSPNWLFFYPGLALAALGILVSALLFTGPLLIEDVRFSISSLIYSGAAIILGIQAVLFAILSRAYAIQEKLLPESVRSIRILKALTLERSLIAGFGLFLLGLALFLLALSKWRAAGFGSLEFEYITRLVLGSSISLSLGFQIILSGFLLSILRLSVRPLLAGDEVRPPSR
jgi:glycosyltransferase involved in cell wall biosynthesis